MACETTRSDKSPNPKEALIQTLSISIIVFGKTQHTFVDLLFALHNIHRFPLGIYARIRPFTKLVERCRYESIAGQHSGIHFQS
jgi:hypothetical protein